MFCSRPGAGAAAADAARSFALPAPVPGPCQARARIVTSDQAQKMAGSYAIAPAIFGCHNGHRPKADRPGGSVNLSLASGRYGGRMAKTGGCHLRADCRG